MAVLFISRGTVCGVQDLVDEVCSRTGASCLSREDLIRQVSQYGDWAGTVVQQLSQATSAYEEFSRTRHVYIVLMRRALLERIQQDRVVYHGLSGHLLVHRLPHFVRIRITEPLAAQISVTMERLHCDKETARQKIREAENQQVRWARFMYGRDVRDPTLYDLNIHLGHFTIDSAVDVVEHLLTDQHLRATVELTAEVGRLLRASKVEAALVLDPRTREHEISATVTDEQITLDGPYLRAEDQQIVNDVVRSEEPTAAIRYVPGFPLSYRLEERWDRIANALSPARS